MKLKLSISTCPNDTFMFDAMLHRRIDTEGLDFDLTMADIEQLNAAALAEEPDVTKLSYLGPRLNPSCNLYFMTALRHNNRSLHKFRSNVKWLIEKNLNFCNYSSISYKCFG